MGDLLFQALQWHAEDVDMTLHLGEDNDSINTFDNLYYMIKVFGATQDGSTVSVTIKNFTPYFYVKLPDKWGKREVQYFKEYITNRCKTCGYSSSIVSFKLVERKDFWGFTNQKLFKFARICFRNITCMRQVQKWLSYDVCVPMVAQKIKFKLYESNIDPFIRFMHINDLEPSGWIKLKPGKYSKTDIMTTNCSIDVEIDWKYVEPYKLDDTAPFLIASFDIECTSSSGEFPVPVKKDYKHVSSRLYDIYKSELENSTSYTVHDGVKKCILHALGYDVSCEFGMHRETIKTPIKHSLEFMTCHIDKYIDDIVTVLSGKFVYENNVKPTPEAMIATINDILTSKMCLPALAGDSIIQIGTTFHRYGQRECCYRHIITLGSCDPIDGVDIETCENEKQVLLKWRDLIKKMNPDVITGYNIFGFDFWYMYERSKELHIAEEFLKLSRIQSKVCEFKENKLSSSALGDNILKFIDMTGTVLIDLMKVVQRDHKLDSYKLDNVAHHFMGLNKHDVSPQDIFRLQKGTSKDRMVIADYCVQDCSLCNMLMIKLEILANNMGMSNVCLVPLSYIFMRGQGIKIFSLVLKECKDAGYLIPVIRPPYRKATDIVEEEDSYEGAIVLDPNEGIYISDPVSVLDYASLYPSSMISENLSHDCIVIDPKYDNLPGVEYLNVTYDVYEGVGDKKVKTGEQICRFVQPPNNEKGIVPNILMKLLKARKTTRKRLALQKLTTKDQTTYNGSYDDVTHVFTTESGEMIEVSNDDSVTDLFNDFQKAVLDGLQNAYKVTANSLYGQIGAKTSPIYLKDIAACTTATGRKMILKAKEFLEQNYNAHIIYGDTDSLFVVFPDSILNEEQNRLTGSDKGKAKIMPSIKTAQQASKEFKLTIKHPHDLEYEKTFWPFILLSKKRYVGNLYEMDDVKCKQKSMGIVLKRRDNAQIVKRVYGGVIDIILNKQNVPESVEFLKTSLEELVNGNCPMEDLVITKSLRSEYKDPTRIAHKVLAERIKRRDPGNAPQVNDRIPFVYVTTNHPSNKKEKVLQGERIEHPDYIKKNNIPIDYNFYITNQIMKPVIQLYSIVVEDLPGFSKPTNYYTELVMNKIYEETTDEKRVRDKLMQVKENDVKELLFDPILSKLENYKKTSTRISKKLDKELALNGLDPASLNMMLSKQVTKPRAKKSEDVETDGQATKPKRTRKVKVIEEPQSDNVPPKPRTRKKKQEV